MPLPVEIRIAAALVCSAILAGCALPQRPPAQVDGAAPSAWQAAVPLEGVRVAHDGSVARMASWWSAPGEALLGELVSAAQAVSPTLAAARSRLEQARAARTVADAALLPALDGSASATRASAQGTTPQGTALQAGLQLAWEIDIFGRNSAASEAAEARFAGAQAGWHDARVSLAADVAERYYSWRACQRVLDVVRADAASRAETARVSQLSADAGFLAPSSAGLTRASAAEASTRVISQEALCDLEVKALVALSGFAEAELRRRLAETPRDLPTDLVVPVSSIPAVMLNQRPDVRVADRQVAAASAEVGQARAQRYPRLGLSGSIGLAHLRAMGGSVFMDTWSIGPLTLTLPIFDGGRGAAGERSAEARYEEAAAVYRGKVRQAVREVEDALVRLESTRARAQDVALAAEGFRRSFEGTDARYRSGLGSLLELEDARRSRLAAEQALVNLQRERLMAWIGLYRAVGGDWQQAAPGTS